MNFVKKIADFFRDLFSKKSDSSSENNEQTNSNEQEVTGDSKFLVFLKKSLASFSLSFNLKLSLFFYLFFVLFLHFAKHGIQVQAATLDNIILIAFGVISIPY